MSTRTRISNLINRVLRRRRVDEYAPAATIRLMLMPARFPLNAETLCASTDLTASVLSFEPTLPLFADGQLTVRMADSPGVQEIIELAQQGRLVHCPAGLRQGAYLMSLDVDLQRIKKHGDQQEVTWVVSNLAMVSLDLASQSEAS